MCKEQPKTCKKHHNYCVSHRYDAKPFSPHVVEVVNANLAHLQEECRRIIRQQSTLNFDDMFADTLIRCANDLKLSEAPDNAILSRFIELFKTTLVDACFKIKNDILKFAEFNGNRGVSNNLATYPIDAEQP